jgi:hypothetical protein
MQAPSLLASARATTNGAGEQKRGPLVAKGCSLSSYQCLDRQDDR